MGKCWDAGRKSAVKVASLRGNTEPVMPTFRTEFPVNRAAFSIDHQHQTMLVGSCFTENIGNRLAAAKFPVTTNPFGIVYNPVSIARSLERLWAGDQPFLEEELLENQGLWHSWEHHSHFSHPDRSAMLNGLNAAYLASAQTLRRTNRLLITLGTADVFSLKTTGQIVANNHKIPAALFQQRRLEVDEIVQDMTIILQKIAAEQADFQVILTVSPVRHLRAGLVENQRSKATLVLACAKICEQLSFATYFPAYELLLDDLRDYRFYAADMVHPSEVAGDYIWQHFTNAFFAPTTQQLINRIEKVRLAAKHRPFHPNIDQHRAFAETQLVTIGELIAAYPTLDFTEEIAHFRHFG